jgi:hypothetical protein
MIFDLLMTATFFVVVIPAQAGIEGNSAPLALGPRFRGDDHKRSVFSDGGTRR